MKWTEVSADGRKRTKDYTTLEEVKGMIEGKTYTVEDFKGSNTLRKAAKAVGKRLRTSARPGNITVVWMEDAKPEQPEIPITPIEAEKVGAESGT